jgi:hypothetical protein
VNRRELTKGEITILEMIRSHYGSRNAPAEVIFMDTGEAVLWVRAEDESIPLVVNLSNLAKWYADGTISTEEELKKDWLQIEDT